MIIIIMIITIKNIFLWMLRRIFDNNNNINTNLMLKLITIYGFVFVYKLSIKLCLKPRML